MVTDRDIVVRTIAEGKDPKSATVSEAMSDQVLYCFEDQSVEEVSANMGAMQVRRLPVVNRDKRLVGIFALGDLAKRGDTEDDAGEALSQISESSLCRPLRGIAGPATRQGKRRMAAHHTVTNTHRPSGGALT